MTSRGSHRRRLISLEELRRARSFKFSYGDGGIPREGLLVSVNGKVAAYENLCRHLPLTLDYGDSRFFTPDGRHLLCRTHGAIYEPATGLCIAGPCAGASLKPLEVVVEDGYVWFLEPAG